MSGWDMQTDLEQRACNVLETLLVAAVVTVALALGAVWIPPHTTPADCVPAVGAPESPVPSPSALCGPDSGADSQGGGG